MCAEVQNWQPAYQMDFGNCGLIAGHCWTGLDHGRLGHHGGNSCRNAKWLAQKQHMWLFP